MNREPLSPERARRVEELYHSALELKSELRAAFLARACAGDDDLLREVASLVAAHERAGSFIEGSPDRVAAQMLDSTATTHEASAARTARRISSDSVPIGGFTPGAILHGRYRIIGLLGRGGMGEVYRADDLKLGQPVALKFLPRAVSSDPIRRERFFSEVRITRQLAHPNICRVYDIAEFEGQHFLSMEYIDGEDLASLIRRIGYLTNEKALDIARQLTAGIAAAHERGVLHRDLKPANIMINGHGRVRITDFGLAVAADSETQAVEMLGTPAYMAPEQFAGKGSSARSDIYALGLILYEIYTGRKAFTATTIPELRAQKEGPTPTAPSEFRQHVDPIVERVIMRCIERDPRARPGSAAQVAAALPGGGDPLAAAVAAGETPSPEMVAAAGLKEGLRPAVAWALLGSLALLLLGAVLLKDRVDLFQRLKATKSPDALAEQARTLINRLGYSDAPVDSEVHFHYSYFVEFQKQNQGTLPIPWNKPDALSPVLFSYRQSPRPLERISFMYIRPAAMPLDPPAFFSGEVVVKLDTEGRLRSFQAIPPAIDTPAPQARPPDWAALFAAAGLDIGAWSPVEPQWNPETFADSKAAWEGFMPDAPGIPIRIEAAGYQGKPVSFTTIYPWTRQERMAQTPSTPYGKVLNVLGTALIVILVAGPAFFARQNLRLGRGDRRGANRMVTALILGPFTVTWILLEQHVATFWELELFVEFLARTMLFGGLFWTLYIAIEPFVRRRWPHILISWTRLLAGEWRDPLVGRDVLIGCVAAIAQWSVAPFGVVLATWFGRPQTALMTPSNPDIVLGTSYFIGLRSVDMAITILLALVATFIFLLARTLFRRDWLAVAVTLLVLTIPDSNILAVAGPWSSTAMYMIGAAIMVFVQMRFGLVAFAATFVVASIFSTTPVTFQNSWYAGYGYAALLIIAALALYGFKTSLGGRPALSFSALDVEPGPRSTGS